VRHWGYKLGKTAGKTSQFPNGFHFSVMTSSLSSSTADLALTTHSWDSNWNHRPEQAVEEAKEQLAMPCKQKAGEDMRWWMEQ